MLITKCPLRISLVGGSTDLHEFVAKYGYGSVISFPCNLYTYITLHENNRDKFIVNYTKNEEVECISDIKNDVAREVLKHFQKIGKLDEANFPKVTISFKSDIYSAGSGLAASSSYLIALIKAMAMHTDTVMADADICRLALEIEKTFNPLTGFQDPYGCGQSGFKKMEFIRELPAPKFYYYGAEILNSYNIVLLHTGIQRSSTTILKNIDIDKSCKLLQKVESMDISIREHDHEKFVSAINEGWEAKKRTSSKIMSPELTEIEEVLNGKLDKEHDGFKLCGAGGGGYFLVFQKESLGRTPLHLDNSITDIYNIQKIHLDQDGIVGIKI